MMSDRLTGWLKAPLKAAFVVEHLRSEETIISSDAARGVYFQPSASEGVGPLITKPTLA